MRIIYSFAESDNTVQLGGFVLLASKLKVLKSCNIVVTQLSRRKSGCSSLDRSTLTLIGHHVRQNILYVGAQETAVYCLDILRTNYEISIQDNCC